MIYRNLSAGLQNPDGAFLAPESPAMVALEVIIDQAGLQAVLQSLATICNLKAEHVAANWQDKPQAKAWDKASAKIDKMAASCEITF